MTQQNKADDQDLSSKLDESQLGFIDQLQSMLDKMVPGEEIEIISTAGPIKIPTTLPARRQVVAFRLLRELLERENVQNSMRSLQAGTAANVVDAIIGLATDEDVAESLSEIFKSAYPDVLPEGVDPMDAVSLEDLVKAILPFSARFASRLGAGLAGLVQPQ